MKLDVYTENKEVFTESDSCDLAWLIYRRFGRNLDNACQAWRRLLINDCSVNEYKNLVNCSNLNDERNINNDTSN